MQRGILLQRDVSGYEKVMSRSVSVGVYSHVRFVCEVSTVREKTFNNQIVRVCGNVRIIG